MGEERKKMKVGIRTSFFSPQKSKKQINIFVESLELEVTRLLNGIKMIEQLFQAVSSSINSILFLSKNCTVGENFSKKFKSDTFEKYKRFVPAGRSS